MSLDPFPPEDAKINLQQRFPNMGPLKGTPTLTTVNGIGAGMYGRRDVDEATGAYIKTHCLCLLFLPVLAFGAYRVVDSPGGGWYFLGAEPLSRLARFWNGLVMSLVLLGISQAAWSSHTASPEYVARQDLKAAQARLRAGECLPAAELFARLLPGSRSAEARPGLQSALSQCVESEAVGTAEAGYRLLGRLGSGVNKPAPLIPDAWGRGLARVEKLRASRPEEALRLLEAVVTLDAKNESIPALRLSLLKELVVAQPGNVDRAVELALAYEKAGQARECVALLRPLRVKLGATEGARILGQQLLQAGNNEEAYGLLHPYVQSRLDRLHTYERAYSNSVAGAYKGALNHLRTGHADPSFYTAHKRAPKREQEEMVEKFVQRWMQQDPTYQRAMTELKSANEIVPVALDLGSVQISRAQGFLDPDQRRQELLAAEKTFLAIRGLAGESDSYRLFLGQVYYWLGRATEGEELFQKLLRTRNRSFTILLALAETLREVGEEKQARELLEEAHRTAGNPQARYRAAASRAVVGLDMADKIAWLGKADPTDVGTQVALNNARGEQALEQGNKEAAASYLRDAIRGYESMTRNSTVLNNTAVAYLSVYEVTGHPSDLTHGLGLLEQAVALEPGNSILLMNTVHMLVSRALLDLVRDRLRLDLIKEQPEPGLLAFLYSNEEERTRLLQQLRASESMQKALTYLDRAILLSPKSRSLYLKQLSLLSGFRDQPELAKLRQRIQAAQLDEGQALEEGRAAWTGAKDSQYARDANTLIRRYEELLRSEAVRQHPATLDYVTVSLNNARLSAALYGAPLDSRLVLESARAAYSSRPSSAARQGLIAAYWAAALQDLGRQDPEIAATSKKTGRLVSSSDLLTRRLDRGGPAAERIRGNAEVQQALRLEKEANAAFPGLGMAGDWALMQALDPAEAASLARAVAANESGRLSSELQFLLSPSSGHALLTQYWSRKLAGDPAGARELYERARRNGMPLPALGSTAAVAGSTKLAGGE